MKTKICIFVLSLCLLQVSLFVPNVSVAAIDDIDDLEFVGLNSEKMQIIYEMMEGTENAYRSNIYTYSSFQESYFDNLTINHGMNFLGSCGYVGIIISRLQT